MVLLTPTLSASVAAQLSGGLCRPSMGASPCSRRGLEPTFLLEGGTWLSRHGGGEQMLLPVCAVQQASSPPKDHGSREHSPPPPSKVCQNRKQKRKGHPNGQARDLWKTLIDLRPACA